jgi:acyl-CoA oxidase
MYGAMLSTRVMIVTEPSARCLAEAATIAVRYSCVRHQSEIVPGEPEPQVLEFQTQQYKVLPELAAAYAYWFTGNILRTNYYTLNEDIQQGKTDALPELHALSAGLKAVVSACAMQGVEQCRLACGGHGYSLSSGLPKLYMHAIPAATYEGENTVLLLQTARYLVKAYQQAQTTPVKGSAAYLGEKIASGSHVDSTLNPQALLDAYKYRATRLISRVSQRLSRLISQGKAAHDAWNMSSVLLTKAAEAHCHYYIAKVFFEKIESISDGAIHTVLINLFQLLICHGIANDAGNFLADNYLSPQQLDVIIEGLLVCLDKLRPNAVSLVDAFDFTDHHLGSVLGRYDGNVYENLYKWAASSPLNKTQVHESFKYLKALAQSKL